MDSPVITRFAPSPTGPLHIGGIRTALINYVYTNKAKLKSLNSKFLLRIEDTDINRSKDEHIDTIINGLKWLGINWDDNIILQSRNIKRHQEIAYKLLKNNLAFKCVCSQEQINKIRIENLKKNLSIKRLCKKCEFDEKVQETNSNFCIRIKVPDDGLIIIEDMIQGNIKINNKEIDNFILLRNNGFPTYMLSVVVDDYDMNVNTIIRGDDHLNNSFRQLYIYKHLKWQPPKYAHLPLVHGEDGSKLSKRHGAIDINEFIHIGYLPKAIINNLILLGWSPKQNNEIIEIKEIIEKFNINDLNKSPSIFDYNKLNFLNNYYIQQNDNYEVFLNYIKNNNLISKYINNKEKIKNIFDAHKSKVTKLIQYIEIIMTYFDENFTTKPDKIIDDKFKKIAHKFLSILKKIKNWNESDIEMCIKNFIKEENLKFSEFGKPVRYILTNNKDGIPISKIFLLLGRNSVFSRISNCINN